MQALYLDTTDAYDGPEEPGDVAPATLSAGGGADAQRRPEQEDAVAAGIGSAAGNALIHHLLHAPSQQGGGAPLTSSSTPSSTPTTTTLRDVITGRLGTEVDEQDLEDYMHVAALWDNLPASQLAAASGLLRQLLRSLGVPAADGQPVPRLHRQRLAAALAAQLGARRLVGPRGDGGGQAAAHALRSAAAAQRPALRAASAAAAARQGTAASRRLALDVTALEPKAGKGHGGQAALLLAAAKGAAVAGQAGREREGRELQEESSEDSAGPQPDAGPDVGPDPAPGPAESSPAPPSSPGDVVIGAAPPSPGAPFCCARLVGAVGAPPRCHHCRPAS